jgi:hypothetical protein
MLRKVGDRDTYCQTSSHKSDGYLRNRELRKWRVGKSKVGLTSNRTATWMKVRSEIAVSDVVGVASLPFASAGQAGTGKSPILGGCGGQWYGLNLIRRSSRSRSEEEFLRSGGVEV